MNARSAAEKRFLLKRLHQLNISDELKTIAEHCIDEIVTKQYSFELKEAILIGIIKGHNPNDPGLRQIFHTYREQDAHFNHSRSALRYILGKGNSKYGTDIPSVPAVDLQLLFSPDPKAVEQHYRKESMKFYKLQDELLKVVMKMVVTTEIWSQTNDVLDTILERKEMEDAV